MNAYEKLIEQMRKAEHSRSDHNKRRRGWNRADWAPGKNLWGTGRKGEYTNRDHV